MNHLTPFLQRRSTEFEVTWQAMICLNPPKHAKVECRRESQEGRDESLRQQRSASRQHVFFSTVLDGHGMTKWLNMRLIKNKQFIFKKCIIDQKYFLRSLLHEHYWLDWALLACQSLPGYFYNLVHVVLWQHIQIEKQIHTVKSTGIHNLYQQYLFCSVWGHEEAIGGPFTLEQTWELDNPLF